MPCPHFDIKIIQRSNRQSAVASAAYQSGERAALIIEYGKEVRNLERRMAELAARDTAGRESRGRQRRDAPER